MLTESFIVSTESLEKSNNANSVKDVGIHHYDFQPLPARKSSYKKSSTKQNCLAVTTTHIFAAQAEKSIVHVYEREKGTQEAVVPFPERICSIALSRHGDSASTLVLGTEGGRVILWELCTGRQVSTPQSHLQPTTCLAVDPTSNFLLSGSPDSNIHLWSIPSLLSFLASSSTDSSQPLPFSPLHSLSNHRATINALAFGHSSSAMNIAVSASADNTCIVWDYIRGSVLHTFLLPSAPLCLALDPADRAVYAGFEDGSIQLVNFYTQYSTTHPLYNPALQSTPTQPPTSDRWHHPSEKPSASLTIQLSYDGTTLLSGHQNGVIQTWDVGKGRPKAELANLSHPITNLIMLPPTGYPNPSILPLKLHKVIKPRYETTLGNSNNNLPSTSTSPIPKNYTITAQFTSTLPDLPSSTTFPSTPSQFHLALLSPTFPPSLLSLSISELSTLTPINPFGPTPTPNPTNPSDPETPQTTHLHTLLQKSLQTQRATIQELLVLDRARYERLEADRIKKLAKKKRRLRRVELEERRRKVEMMGAEAVAEDDAKVRAEARIEAEVETEVEAEAEIDVDIDTTEEKDKDDAELSSSTDEMTESE